MFPHTCNLSFKLIKALTAGDTCMFMVPLFSVSHINRFYLLLPLTEKGLFCRTALDWVLLAVRKTRGIHWGTKTLCIDCLFPCAAICDLWRQDALKTFFKNAHVLVCRERSGLCVQTVFLTTCAHSWSFIFIFIHFSCRWFVYICFVWTHRSKKAASSCCVW